MNRSLQKPLPALPSLVAAVFVVRLLAATAAAPAPADPRASYPPSPVIRGLAIESARHSVGDGDNWPITWADDGDLYTVYCDGKGFGGGSGQGSMSLARIIGTPPDHRGENIASVTAHKLGDGHGGRKASGLLMVDGVLYMWVRNLNQDGTGSSLAWSGDHAKTWSWAEWNFPQIGYPVWLNAGRNYEWAQDDYAYMYSPDTPSAYAASDHTLLARVPKAQIIQIQCPEMHSGGATMKPHLMKTSRRPFLSRPSPGCAAALTFRPNLVPILNAIAPKGTP